MRLTSRKMSTAPRKLPWGASRGAALIRSTIRPSAAGTSMRCSCTSVWLVSTCRTSSTRVARAAGILSRRSPTASAGAFAAAHALACSFICTTASSGSTVMIISRTLRKTVSRYCW